MRKISIVLNFLLFALICILSFNISGKGMLVSALVEGRIGNLAAERMMDAVMQEFPNASLSQLTTIQNNLEDGRLLKNMAEAYLDQTVKDVVDKRPVTAPANMEEAIDSMADEALADITKVMGGGSENGLKEMLLKESSEINEAISTYVQELISNLRSGPMKLLIMAYWAISSWLCTILCIVGMLLIFGALFLIKKRLLPVIGSCKWPILLSGLFLVAIVTPAIKSVWPVIANRFFGGRVYGINSSGLTGTGVALIVVGVVFFIISFIKKRRIAKD